MGKILIILWIVTDILWLVSMIRDFISMYKLDKLRDVESESTTVNKALYIELKRLNRRIDGYYNAKGEADK